MNNSPADRQSPLGLFPGEPTPRLYDRVVEVLRTRIGAISLCRPARVLCRSA
jgi:hypothetical protein